jgi:hypothetical protein
MTIVEPYDKFFAILIELIPNNRHKLKMLCRLEPVGAFKMHSAYRRRLAGASTLESTPHIAEHQVRAARLAKTQQILSQPSKII